MRIKIGQMIVKMEVLVEALRYFLDYVSELMSQDTLLLLKSPQRCICESAAGTLILVRE